MVRRSVGAWLGVLAFAFVTTACSKSDPGITTAVKTKLAADDSVKAYKIDVDTKNGVVTLAGVVDTSAEKGRAVELAKGTEGVKDVVDQLVITPVAPTSGVAIVDTTPDGLITTAIKTKFLADTAISGLAINIDTKDNVVTLTGTVPTAAERDRAVEVAKKTDGVKSVVDNLKVGK